MDGEWIFHIVHANVWPALNGVMVKLWHRPVKQDYQVCRQYCFFALIWKMCGLRVMQCVDYVKGIMYFLRCGDIFPLWQARLGIQLQLTGWVDPEVGQQVRSTWAFGRRVGKVTSQWTSMNYTKSNIYIQQAPCLKGLTFSCSSDASRGHISVDVICTVK